MSSESKASRRDTSRPRVIFFSPGQHEPGGCASHSTKLASELADRGWDVRSICWARSARQLRVHRGPRLTIEIPGFGTRIGVLGYLVVGFVLGVAWGRRGARVLAMQLGSQSLLAWATSRVRGLPTVVMSTTSGEWSEALTALRSRRRALHLHALRKADLLVGQTEAAADELRETAPGNRVVAIPTPMPDLAPRPISGRPVAAYCGRLTEEKDLDVLLDAFESVIQTLSDAELVLIGDGSGSVSVEDDLHERVRSSRALSRSVRFTGFVADPESQVAAADIFVIASRTEGMSNSLLEACALERIIVASNIPANVAVLGEDHPLLFPVGDSTELASQLRRAFCDSAAREAALKHARRARSLCALTTVVDELEGELRRAHRTRHQHG